MSLQEYNVDINKIEEWVPWGGLTMPHVLENKDGSFVAIVQYDQYPPNPQNFDLPEFCRGWVVTVEEQHFKNPETLKMESKYFIVFCWNPFKLNSGIIRNTLNKPVRIENALKYFGTIVLQLADRLSKVTKVKVLEYQEILDFLAFSISFKPQGPAMPEIPLCIDVLMTQNLEIHFAPNSVRQGKSHFVIYTILGMPDLKKVFYAFMPLQYRHVKRVLCFNKKQSEKVMKGYSNHWCPKRKYMKNAILGDLLDGNLLGYYSEYFIFLVPDEYMGQVLSFNEDLFTKKRIGYRLESFNAKDIWWGSLPGCFRADIHTPIIGFKDVDELMSHTPEAKKKVVLTDKDTKRQVAVKGGLV